MRLFLIRWLNLFYTVILPCDWLKLSELSTDLVIGICEDEFVMRLKVQIQNQGVKYRAIFTENIEFAENANIPSQCQ